MGSPSEFKSSSPCCPVAILCTTVRDRPSSDGPFPNMGVAQVIPCYTVSMVVLVTIFGGFIFDEFRHMSLRRTAIFTTGGVLDIVGLLILSSRQQRRSSMWRGCTECNIAHIHAHPHQHPLPHMVAHAGARSIIAVRHARANECTSQVKDDRDGLDPTLD